MRTFLWISHLNSSDTRCLHSVLIHDFEPGKSFFTNIQFINQAHTMALVPFKLHKTWKAHFICMLNINFWCGRTWKFNIMNTQRFNLVGWNLSEHKLCIIWSALRNYVQMLFKHFHKTVCNVWLKISLEICSIFCCF